MEHTYREMRRRDRLATQEEMDAVLAQGEYGFMATVGDDGLPYGVPLSYVVMDGFIYFHCAHIGRKIDNLAFQDRVSFAVVVNVRPYYEENNFSTIFDSVIVQGRAEKVSDEAEREKALMELAQKYLPDYMEHAPESIRTSMKRTAVYRISMDYMTGKKKRPKAEGGKTRD